MIRVNAEAVRGMENAIKFSNVIYDLAERGYKIHIRYVSLLDFIPELPLVSRLLRFILFKTGLWKRQLWLEVSISRAG
jgi:hypothetical protein